MMLVATFLLVLSQGWVGLWDLQIPEAVEQEVHLVVHSKERVELFNPDWLPYVVIFSRFDDEEFEIHATFESRGDIFVLKGQRGETRISGHAEYQGRLPQYTLRQEMSGERILSEPIPSPLEWLRSLQEDEVIDVVDVVLEKGRDKSLSDFREAWDEAVQRYYYLLKDWNTGADFLEKLHNLLDSSSEWEKPSDSASLLQGFDADYLVLLPSITERQPHLIELPTALNEFPGDREPCCGEDRYRMEKFLLYPVTPTTTP